MSQSQPVCQGKRWFRTRGLAKQIAQQMRRKWHEPLEEYFCRHCGRWHVGHSR